jgi:preprotein translocase subunit SecG
MFQIFLIIQVLLGLSIIGLVLLQQGKGADMGAAFGSGSSGTVFGSRGGGSFFTRLTGVLAALFFANSILLSSPLVHDRDRSITSVTEQTGVATEVEETLTEEVPAIDVPPADLPDMPALESENLELDQESVKPDDLPE